MGALWSPAEIEQFTIELRQKQESESRAASEQLAALKSKYKDCPNNLIVGPAGSGKSYCFTHHPKPEVRLCGTTGVASRNLGDGVTTLHSLLGMQKEEDIDEVRGGIAERIKGLKSDKVERLVIDEASMLRSHTLDVLVEEFANSGIGITLCGDFAQLAPVSGSASGSVPWAFNSQYWPMFEANKIVKKKVLRQKNVAFLDALNILRGGINGSAFRCGQACELLKMAGVRFLDKVDEGLTGFTLFCRNESKDEFNRRKLAELNGQALEYSVCRRGKQQADWDFQPVTLKVGARVMITTNERDVLGFGFRYVNGDTGIVEDLNPNAAIVRLDHKDKVANVGKKTQENWEVRGWKYIWTKENGYPEEKLVPNKELVGSISYLPIVPCWASTVHKVQGMTVEKDYLQVDLKQLGNMHAITYVACSRVKEPSQLILIGGADDLKRACWSSKEVKEAGYLDL